MVIARLASDRFPLTEEIAERNQRHDVRIVCVTRSENGTSRRNRRLRSRGRAKMQGRTSRVRDADPTRMRPRQEPPAPPATRFGTPCTNGAAAAVFVESTRHLFARGWRRRGSLTSLGNRCRHSGCAFQKPRAIGLHGLAQRGRALMAQRSHSTLHKIHCCREFQIEWFSRAHTPSSLATRVL